MDIPTGISPLDERLDGGVFPGTLFVITLPPGGEYIPLMRAGLRQESSIILSSLKNEGLVANMLDRSAINTDDVDIGELDPGKAPETISQKLNHLDNNTSLYVNTIGPIERSVPTDIYIDLMNMLSERLEEAETTGHFFCYRDDDVPYNRIVTLDIADFVIEIERVRESDRLTHRLRVPKANGVVLDESDRTFEVTIDQDPPNRR